MARNFVRRWALVLALGLFLASALGSVLYWETRKKRLYAAGEAAVAAGQWPEALRHFRAVVEIDPAYRDAQEKLDQAVGMMIPVAPGGDSLEAEALLLSWLSESGDWATLAEVLDRCVVLVPAGPFIMGSDTDRADERPQRPVFLDAFEIDRYEVSNIQYLRFLEATGRDRPPHWIEGLDPYPMVLQPVVGVTWAEAEAYCAWVGKRLPTEAEWEKACRGSDGRSFPWGDTWDPSQANVDDTAGRSGGGFGSFEEAWELLRSAESHSEPRLEAVVAFASSRYVDGASPYGVVHLVGNASEWVADWYNGRGYGDLPASNPYNTAPEWNHVVRGSSWYELSGRAEWVQDSSRCAARNSAHVYRDPRIGFRCAR